jgi:hypothetical protein
MRLMPLGRLTQNVADRTYSAIAPSLAQHAVPVDSPKTVTSLQKLVIMHPFNSLTS